jgi:hypothetical protein
LSSRPSTITREKREKRMARDVERYRRHDSVDNRGRKTKKRDDERANEISRVCARRTSSNEAKIFVLVGRCLARGSQSPIACLSSVLILCRTEMSLVEKYGPYTIDYDEDTSVKRIKTLRNIVVSNTAV